MRSHRLQAREAVAAGSIPRRCAHGDCPCACPARVGQSTTRARAAEALTAALNAVAAAGFNRLRAGCGGARAARQPARRNIQPAGPVPSNALRLCCPTGDKRARARPVQRDQADCRARRAASRCCVPRSPWGARRRPAGPGLAGSSNGFTNNWSGGRKHSSQRRRSSPCTALAVRAELLPGADCRESRSPRAAAALHALCVQPQVADARHGSFQTGLGHGFNCRAAA